MLSGGENRSPLLRVEPSLRHPREPPVTKTQLSGVQPGCQGTVWAGGGTEPRRQGERVFSVEKEPWVKVLRSCLLRDGRSRVTTSAEAIGVIKGF